MKRTMINEVIGFEAQSVTVSGWVHRIRKLKSVVFVILRDRTAMLQLTLSPESFDSNPFRLESVIEATGLVVSNTNKYNNVEIQVKSIRILSEVSEDLPIQINGKKTLILA